MITDLPMLFAFIEVESAFDAHAFLADSNGGSYGLTQLDYSTAKDRGFIGNPIHLYNPVTNIKYFQAQIEWITKELASHGLAASIDNIAASYNSGLQHILDGATDPAYVAKITAAYARWQAALNG